jgi:hypothetical protein
MRVVALRARVERFHVPKARVIHPTGVLIAAIGAPRQQGAGGREIVNVEKADVAADLVITAQPRRSDGLLHVEA